MDRNDEKKERVEDTEDVGASRRGDILGLGDAPVPKAPSDPSTEYDAESVAKRRARALENEEAGSSQENPNRQGGATGVDMGAGGQGTLLGGE